MKKVSIKQAIVNAVDETDSSLMRFEIQALNWAKYIEGQIGSHNGYKIASKSFTVDGEKMTVPENCIRIHRILWGNYEDQISSYYKDSYLSTIQQDNYSEESVIVKLWSPAEAPSVADVLWEQYGNVLQFMHEMNGREITIIYSTIEADNDGYWLVNETHIPAITDYILYKFAKKRLSRTLNSDKMLRQNEIVNIRDMKQQYEVSIRNARANDQAESEFERNQM